MRIQATPFYMLRASGIMMLLIFFFTGCKQESFNPSLTQEFCIQSTSSGAMYKIKVALPVNYDSRAKKYGAIYVLDGDENFDFVATRCNEISNDRSVDNVIVVSIGCGNDRSLDYTPTKLGSATGGAPQFMNFIKRELIPKMQQLYTVDTTRNSRVILGHSYGGLLGAYAFATDNKVFGNYILLSPSIWYDNEVILRYERDNRVNNKSSKHLVFMGIGEMENSGRMQAPFEAFYQALLKNYPSLSIGKNRERNLDHVGSKNPNIILGLTYYFEHKSL